MGTQTGRLRRATAVVVAAAGLAVGVAGCADSAGPDGGTTLQDLQLDGSIDDAGEDEIARAGDDDTELFLPDQASYLGREVTVSGRVVEVFSPHAFVIGEDDLATLVVRPDTALPVQPGMTAQVTGTVGPFVLVEVEEELDADLVDDDFRDFESVPHIRARNVNLLDSDR